MLIKAWKNWGISFILLVGRRGEQTEIAQLAFGFSEGKLLDWQNPSAHEVLLCFMEEHVSCLPAYLSSFICVRVMFSLSVELDLKQPPEHKPTVPVWLVRIEEWPHKGHNNSSF